MPATNGPTSSTPPRPSEPRRSSRSRSNQDPRWVVTSIRLAGVVVFLSQAVAFPLLGMAVDTTALIIAGGAMGVAEAAKVDIRRWRDKS